MYNSYALWQHVRYNACIIKLNVMAFHVAWTIAHSTTGALIAQKTCRQFNVGAVHDAWTIAHSTTVAITIAHVPVLLWG